jgi:hypothetical protein
LDFNSKVLDCGCDQNFSARKQALFSDVAKHVADDFRVGLR